MLRSHSVHRRRKILYDAKLVIRDFINGAKQFVVHEAFGTTVSVFMESNARYVDGHAILRRRRDNDLLGTTFDVQLGLLTLSETRQWTRKCSPHHKLPVEWP
jgi:hypothetical protein